MTKHDYQPTTLDQIPDGVRFDVPMHRQGQIVEVAYGGFGRPEHGPGDEYKRVHDRSEGPNAVRYYRLFKATP